MSVTVSRGVTCNTDGLTAEVTVIVYHYMETLPFSYTVSIRNASSVTVYSKNFTFATTEGVTDTVTLPNGSYTMHGTDGTQVNSFVVDCVPVIVCDLVYTGAVVTPDINGQSTGTAKINSSGSYTKEFSLDNINWQPSNTFTGLGAGVFVAYIRDVNGCKASGSFTIVAGACTIAISSLDTTNETEPGANNGTVSSNILGNIGTNNYSLDGTTYVPTPFFGNLAPGNYTYYVKDSVSCTATYPFTIGQAGVKGFDPVPVEYLEDERMTVSYQPELESFTALHSYVPNHYVSRGNRVFMIRNAESTIWELNKGRKGVYFDQDPEPFSITFVINPFPSVSKVYDNFVLITNSKNNGKEVYTDTFNKLQVWNLYQNSGEVTLVIGRQQVIDVNNRFTQTKAELVNNEFRISVPRNIVADALGDIFNPENLVTSSLFDGNPNARKFRDQMRDKFLVIKLTYDNATDYELDLIGLKSIFRAIAR